MTSLISIRGLRKTYRMGDENVHALAGVDLDFAAGEFVAILGPSGSGKSTLMHILGFMDTPSEGSIVLEGEEVARLGADRRAWYRSNRVGFVFQSFNLLPRLTVLGCPAANASAWRSPGPSSARPPSSSRTNPRATSTSAMWTSCSTSSGRSSRKASRSCSSPMTSLSPNGRAG